MRRCPHPRILHGLVDGLLPAPARRRVETHLPECRRCRDRARELRRVQRFLERPRELHGGQEEAAALVAAARERVARTEPPPHALPARGRPSRRVLAGAAAAAAAALVLLLPWTADSPGEGRENTETVSAAGTVDAVCGVLQELDPVADGNRPYEARLQARLEAAGLLDPGDPGARRKAGRLLEAAMSLAPEIRQRLRAARAALRLQRPGARGRVVHLLREASVEGPVLEALLLEVGTSGGTSAANSLLALARQRSLPPAALGRALVATGAPRIAGTALRLLRKGGLPETEALQLVAALPGPEAARLLVEPCLEADAPAELVRALAKRQEATALLQARLDREQGRGRVRLLELLGLMGEDEAVEELRRGLKRRGTSGAAWEALRHLAAAGLPGALDGLVAQLPLDRRPLDWWQEGRLLDLRSALRDLPEARKRELEKRLVDVGPTGATDRDRRRLLLAVGAAGSSRAWELLGSGRSWEPPQDVRVRALALALTGDPRAVQPLAGLARSSAAHTRRQALVALVAAGGEQAAHVLVGALSRPRDREAIVEALERRAGPWAVPVLEAACGYSDVRQQAEAVLSALRVQARSREISNSSGRVTTGGRHRQG